MLKLFQNTKPTSVLIIILLAFIMKWQVLVHPALPFSSEGHFLFGFCINLIKIFFGKVAISYSFLSISIILIQAFYLNNIVTKHKLFAQNGFIPAFSYILITSLYPSLNYFNEQLLINFFVFAGIDKILGLSHASNPRTEIFNAGFLMCFPVLFQLSGIGFLILFLISLALLRPFNLAEWVVGLIGFFTPIYFFICFLYLFDKLPILQKFSLLSINHVFQKDIKGLLLILLIGVFILIIVGLIALQQNLPRVTIYVRRSWLLILCYCIIAIGAIFLSSKNQYLGWILLMPPLSLIISQSFCLEKTKRFSSFTFYFALILFIFSQLI